LCSGSFGGIWRFTIERILSKKVGKVFKKLISVSVALKQQIQRVFLFLREYT